MTFHIDPKTMKSEFRVDPTPLRAESMVDMSDPYAGGYRPAVSVDLSQCNTLHRQKAIAAHKHAIATAETDAYAKPAKTKGISWGIVWFLLACALLGLCLLAGVVGVMA